MNNTVDIGYLKQQRNLLVSQVDNYKSLKQQIGGSSPQSGKVMVLIGDGYFVEKTVSEALRFLDRRISSLSGVIERFNHSINREEAFVMQMGQDGRKSKTFELSDKEVSINAVNEEGLPFKDIVERIDEPDKKQDGKNEDGMPFMDIIEQLDEEDNVIGVTINNEKQEVPKKEVPKKEVPKKEVPKKEQEESKISKVPTATDKVKALNLGDGEFVDIREELDDGDNVVNVEFKKDSHTEPADDSDAEDQFQELLEDMEVVGKSPKASDLKSETSIIQKIEDLDVSSEDKAKIKDILLRKGEPKIEEITEPEIVNGEVRDPNFDYEERPPQDHITVARDDLLELEMIADQFNEEDEFEGDEEYEFEFDEDQDDDDADDDAYEAKFIGDNKLNNMLWSQINALRQSKNANVNEQAPEAEAQKETQTKDTSSEPKRTKGKKEVKFSENLEIFEVDRIKKEDYEEPQRMSKFKQLKERHKDSRVEPVSDIVEREAPVSDIIERAPVSDIIERSAPVSDIMERPMSNFVETPLGDVAQGPVADIMEHPVSDIVEETIVERPGLEESLSVSDIVETPVMNAISESPVDTISESPVDTISETISEPIEKTTSETPEYPPPKRVSRFRQAREERAKDAIVKTFGTTELTAEPAQTPSVSSVVMSDITEHEEEPTAAEPVDSELMDMIKQYNIENDQIEGPVIKTLNDIKKLNEMHEELDVDSYEIQHDHEHEHEHVHEHDQENDENNHIVEIKENETHITGDLDQVIESEQLEDQVKREYFSLKDKLLAKRTPQEFESDVKVSRFKQRLSK